MAEEKAMLITTRTVGENERNVFLREAEIRSLINTLDIKIVCHQSFTIKEENTNTFIGPGQAEAAAEYMRAFDVDEVIIDVFLSPRQEKNLEKMFSVPVSDREAVILAIFYKNAHSREARLQIEKAEAIYLKPRLISREANLSQQRGGVRGAKGEGERKLELERRRIEQRIKILDKEIAEIQKIRDTQRSSREKSGIFSFALTGYTNAGKSTILNALTGSDVLSEDKLFATLDTTTRSLKLPNGQKVLLSDTVGFISDLPHLLIEAFSSTLNEALNSDGIIIVADASHPDAVGCLNTTIDTLTTLGAIDKVRLLVINKCDEIHDDISFSILKGQNFKTVETSFKDGSGIDILLKALAEITDEDYSYMSLEIPIGSEIISELSRNGELRGMEYKDNTIVVNARIPKGMTSKYSKYSIKA
ncbi:MAG: GTPase HflX [Spirochaetales bacterium]|nr:GTPase HflX [Spirochaetales bacterium]